MFQRTSSRIEFLVAGQKAGLRNRWPLFGSLGSCRDRQRPARGTRVGHHGDMQGLDYQVKNGKSSWGGRLLRDWVDDVVAPIVEQFHPAAVILFGSVADGTDGPDSDLDLLVVLDDAPVNRRRELMVELRRATRGVDVPRDLLVTSSTDLERNRHIVGTTEYGPANHGVVVYERRTAA